MASRTLIEKIQDQFREADLQITLQDYSDDEIKKLILENNPKTWWELEYILLELAEDDETIAHILGFKSVEDRKRMVEETNELIRKEQEYINEH